MPPPGWWWTFVADVVDALARSIDYSGDESIFNVGGGSRIALNTALDIISGLMPGGLDVQYEDFAKGDVRHTYADISLARRELGYDPKTTVEVGIAREIDWLKTTLAKLGRGGAK